MTHSTYSCDYWYYEKAFNDEQCEKLLNLKKQYQLETATIDQGNIDDNIRKNEIFFTSEEWVYEMIRPYLADANVDANWNFDLNWCEPAQFTEYKNGGHYTWHTDAMAIEQQEKMSKKYKGKIRKISTTVLLSNGDDYEGGDFELINTSSLTPNSEDKIEILKESAFRKKGTIIFFPSSVHHRVTPIISGVRNSLVFWWLGPPFK